MVDSISGLSTSTGTASFTGFADTADRDRSFTKIAPVGPVRCKLLSTSTLVIFLLFLGLFGKAGIQCPLGRSR